MRNTLSDGKYRADQGVQLDGGLEVVAERLLDDHPAPLLALRLTQARTLELAQHHRERARRDRQVERVIAARAADPVEFVQGLGQRVESRVVVEGALHESESLREVLPDLFGEAGSRVLTDGVVHHLGEVFLRPVAAGEPDERETGRQQAAVREVVDRRHQLLAREIAGDAEDDDPRWTGDERQSLVPGIAERIGRPAVPPARCRDRHRRCSFRWAATFTSALQFVGSPIPGVSRPACASRARC